MKTAVIVLSAFLFVILSALAFAVYKIISLKKTVADRSGIDDMTGLLNRDGFMYAGKEILEHLQSRTNGEAALILFDVDRLRLINTLFGTDEGDKVVCAFAEAAKSIAGKGDIVGRVDTDDFALLTRLRGREPEDIVEHFEDNSMP